MSTQPLPEQDPPSGPRMDRARTAGHQLRYYIAFSAPPTRTPADGSEPFVRAEVGFTPSWFHEFCGIDFSERWHRDADYRMKSYELMRDEVRRRFPDRGIGGDDDQPPDLLTGIYGGCVVAAMFGQGIQYWPDNFPASSHDFHLSAEQASALTPVEPDENPFFLSILEQLDRILELTGTARGFLNWQGVLNTAFRLRSADIFTDLIDDPGRARHVFDCVATTMIAGLQRLHEVQRKAGVDYRFATISNCVVNMISPEHYEEYLLPFDRKIRDRFESFGIHNCAWTVDPYMDAYAQVPDLGYLDMGLDSDLSRAKRLFPVTRRNVLYTAMDMAEKTKGEIRSDFERIARELGPCDLGLPNMETRVPDERILWAMDLCQELSECAAVSDDSGAAADLP